jgi:hypothetical protein
MLWCKTLQHAKFHLYNASASPSSHDQRSDATINSAQLVKPRMQDSNAGGLKNKVRK